MSSPTQNHNLLLSFLIIAFAGLAGSVLAQDTDEALFEGAPRENAVVGHDLALRLRFEAQVTEDSDELIDTDVAYARYPSRMYASEAKLFQSSRATMSASYAAWENDQDMDTRAWSWRVRWPLYA
jgi:hypothetical protein